MFFLYTGRFLFSFFENLGNLPILFKKLHHELEFMAIYKTWKL